jgi:UDP:flavonoid glycosyltransferase YjiC (YdhE family)
MVVVPVMWDQPENAQRIAEASAGVRLAPGRCTAKRLRGAVEQVLGDGTYRRNAERLGAALRRYGGPEQAAGLLERVLRTRTEH